MFLFRATCSLVFADSAGRMCVLDVSLKEKAFRFIVVYVSNDLWKRICFFS